MNDALRSQLSKIACQYPEVQSILLFGSRAYGDHGILSDIDLAIKALGISKLDWLLLTEQIEV